MYITMKMQGGDQDENFSLTVYCLDKRPSFSVYTKSNIKGSFALISRQLGWTKSKWGLINHFWNAFWRVYLNQWSKNFTLERVKRLPLAFDIWLFRMLKSSPFMWGSLENSARNPKKGIRFFQNNRLLWICLKSIIKRIPWEV